MIKIKYLGTGAAEAVPGLFCDCVLCRHALDEGGKNVRMRSSAVINDKILVDLSPDFAPARANFKIDTSLIDIVLVTHTHQDHFNINMLSYNCPSFTVNPRPMRMYLSRYAARMLKKSEIEKKEEALANITLTEAEPFAEYKECDYTIVPLEAAHSAPQSLLYLISYQGKTLLYGNDTGMLTKKTVKYLKDRKLDIVSLDATSGKAKGHKDRHMGFGEIVNLKDYFMANGNCDKNSAIIATHFSHFIGMPHDEIEKYLKGYGIIAAYDGMEVER